ncbi:MAG: histidine kinase [Bacteroidetes bacterium]|nr:MAG: histidine kinase [Bacteroidota bacterium]
MSEISSKLIPFRPKARIMRTLGEELISSETVAILELVKNSYDADATNVLIRFTGELTKGNGCIEVLDNGHGMSLTDVASSWMEPATNSKRTRSRTERFNRRLLGEKGVGRLATSRISHELELVSRSEGQESEVITLFDWSAFDDESKYLDEVEILSEVRSVSEIMPGGIIDCLWDNEELPIDSERSKGTILRMKRLMKSWNNDDLESLQRGLSRLVSPFDRNKNFIIRMELPPDFSQYSQVISPPAVIKFPHYSVSGIINSDGECKIKVSLYAQGLEKEVKGYFGWVNDGSENNFFRLNSKQYEDLSEESLFTNIETGPFEFELRIWDRDELGNVVQKTQETITDIRSDLDSVAGINIYRDGFRVLPYGEPDNDWLRLDARRVQKPTMRLSNNQILGFINITADDNPKLKDQSNREGLDENQALEDLRQILYIILNDIERERYDMRPRQKSEKVFSTPIQGLFSAVNFVSVREKVLEKYPEDKELLSAIDASEENLQKKIEDIQIVLARHQKLATLGTLIDIVLHDGRHPLSVIVNQSILGRETIESLDQTETNESLSRRFTSIEESGNVLSTVFRRIEPFGGRKRGKPTQLYLEEIIGNAIAIFETEIDKLKVNVHLPKSENLVRLDPAEIQQVIINLIDNSLYWLKLESPENREILIDIQRNEDGIQVLFSDSGPGIEDHIAHRIFEPYFSMKPDGIGLGLAIAGEIIEDYYGGSIELVKGQGLKGATFLIQINKRV